ncbi:MAG: DUF362 domain-containing protein [Kiritimatiellae bacterium]|nr:DUF362 domain-containing protein [Kiritimatiellia bacterium]MDW8459018.1 DUF362 domain-containing protein [Verrucomicrobiota bacterium]
MVWLEDGALGYPPISAAPYNPSESYPEYNGPLGKTPNPVYAAVRRALANLNLDAKRLGRPDWNPIGELVPPGSRIVIKPNWVLHANEGPGGTDCLITHASILRAVIDYALRARPAMLVVGDAPVQVCRFDALLGLGFERVAEWYRTQGVPIEVKDFRRTITVRGSHSVRVQTRLRPMEEYRLVDLGAESLLEPISADFSKFRVTMYNPDDLPVAHAPGRHRYLIARDVLEADLVINVPKVKTHMKAGVTLALKNLVGINGSKEFLPHHRKGAADSGGDNYERRTLPKALLEDVLDWMNRHALDKPNLYGVMNRIAYKILWFDRIRGLPANVEGGWHGNDTVWRMCLDLNTILLYADREGRLREMPQRVTLHVGDGIIAGEGDGPLRPDPVPFGLVTAALNAAAHDWAVTTAMGLDPRRIPIICRAFDTRPHPLAGFGPADIEVVTDGVAPPRALRPASGWRGHCESVPEERCRA